MSWRDDLAAEIAALDASYSRRTLRPVRRVSATRLSISNRDLINFASNDYLGLATNETVRKETAASVEAGVGSGSSRLLSGTHQEHIELECAFASFSGMASSVLFSSGYHANLSIVQSLVGKDDAVFSDALNHASLVDACRLSRANTFVYRHGEVDHLASLLNSQKRARRRLVVTESLFGMDGDTIDLDAIFSLCRDLDAILVVDDAHASGVYGPSGGGLSHGRCDVSIHTLGKAFGVFGALIASCRMVTETLINRARPFLFTTAPPPALAVAARAALRIITSPAGDVLRQRLIKNAQLFRQGVADLHTHGACRSQTHIFPVLLETPDRALAAARRLEARGFFVPAIRPPTVPAGTSRLRISITAEHSESDIYKLLEALRDVLRAA